MRILLLAGEESGVIYARRIAEQVRLNDPGVEIRGYADYGFQTGDLAVFGYWAVIRRIFFFLRVKRTMERAIDEWKPDVVCTIDYPGMNLKLAAYAKSHGAKAVHVVCPQVWAWHRGRIPKIEAALDKLCCFLPFEPKIFRPGLAEFVGHPLAEEMTADGCAWRERFDSRRGRKRLAILPGSRLGEIGHHLSVLLEAVRGLDCEIAIPAANAKAQAAIERMVKRSGLREVRVQRGGARELLRNADCAVVASGTATLEAALARCPTVLVYRVSALLAAFLKRAIVGVKHVGLANVICEKAGAECPMPELLQEQFTVENVRFWLEKWMASDDERRSAAEALDRSMRLLTSDGNSIARIAGCLLA